MAGLKQFKFIPKDLMEWSRWMRDQDVEKSLGNPDATERVLTSTIEGVRSWIRRFDRWPAQFRGSTDQSLSTTAVTIDLATTDYDLGVNYGLDADSVSIQAAGHYKISYEVYASVDSVAGALQGNLLTWLTREDESTVIPGSYAATYIEETTTPDVSAGTSCIMLLTEGQGVAIRAQLSAAIDVSTVADRCKLIIERVR